MTGADDGSHAPPPVFEGEPGAQQTPRGFQWNDLLEGTGDFCVDPSSTSHTRWKQMSSTTKQNVSVTTFSRSLEDKNGLCEFLIRGKLPIPRDTYFCVNADMEYRPEWDETCVSLSEISSSGPSGDAGPLVERERVLHWNVSYPWPLGKRDYVLEQTVCSGLRADGRVFRCTQGQTVDAEVGKRLRPTKKGVTRIEDYRAHMAIWSGNSEQEACFALLYFEDGKLNVPAWVLTKAAATTIPSQLAAVVPVAANYPNIRARHILSRYGAGPAPGEVTPRTPISKHEPVDDVDDEAFFSASDSDSPKPVRQKSNKASRVVPKNVSPKPSESSITASPTPTDPLRHSPKPGHLAKVSCKTESGVEASPKMQNLSKVAVAPKKRPAHHQQKDKRQMSSLEKALRLVTPGYSKEKVEADSDEDLEEGVKLIIKKEDRDLLLHLLAEARNNQSGSWWCCPCRRRCSHKGSHKS